jgi:hypothetical protein
VRSNYRPLHNQRILALRKIAQGARLLLMLLIFMVWRAGLLYAADFVPFFAAFKTAVARNDAKTVAAMTELPFLFDSKLRDSIGFQKIYLQLFDARVRACFVTAKAVLEDDAQVVNCGRYMFYFRIVKGRYRFIEFAADPEAVH